MSTSLLYHCFGIVGYQHVHSKFEKGKVHFRVQQERDQLRCPSCASDVVCIRGRKDRTFRTVSIGKKPAFVTLSAPRVECLRCDTVRQVKIGFADPRKRYTRSFERYALDLSRRMAIQDVAEHLEVNWDTIKEIQAKNLKRRFGKPKFHKLKEIAIDEICIGSGHRYITLVLNLRNGVVVFVGDGKGSEALTPFWQRLRRSGAKVKAVAIDMSRAYIKAVRENLPKAVLAFDHFHVIKLFNEKLTALRRSLYNQASTEEDRKVLKGTRWLFRKNPENLDSTRNEVERLKEALALNEPLAIAYYLKEDLRHLWSQPNKWTARRVLKDWLARARASKIRILEQFADTLEEHKEGILNYYSYRISTGPLEGTNNKIRVMNHQAYGFRDHDFFKLKILGIHQSRRALVG